MPVPSVPTAIATTAISSVDSKTANTVVKATLGFAALTVGYLFYRVSRTINNVKDTIRGGTDWILETLQLQESEQDKIIDAFKSDKCWNYTYWNDMYEQNLKNGKFLLFGNKALTGPEMATSAFEDLAPVVMSLHNAIEGVGTDESAIYAAFKRVSSKAEVSCISLMYHGGYEKDLYEELQRDLSNSEMIQVIGIVAAYDDYKTYY